MPCELKREAACKCGRVCEYPRQQGVLTGAPKSLLDAAEYIQVLETELKRYKDAISPYVLRHYERIKTLKKK